ncbi:cobaltochelatase CobN subunit [Methanococcoides vulcani]|uniref:Cobaltochelatase CobN subunit n=1 Tax=Methanococcoides vulcani TaxID=1353158 RepID=A0A1H9ZS80_9EURY|nr:cobaltochelatase subunit CobN [Methanococcoides vulcani]SES84524.1 cobaltochelatase CobN subunit [Methanococcoides vulcani]
MRKCGILALSILLLLALAMPVVSAGNYENMEVVANTTSDENGNFSFSDVPNGNYRLASVIYSTAMGGMWLTNVSDFTVENGTAMNITFAMRKNESNDHDVILAYLDRTAVSGRTVSKSGSAKVGTNLVLTDQNGEFVDNTTSNETGYYLFDNVPNGDYSLSGVIYSTAMGGMWLTNVSEFTVENGTPMNITFAMRKNESNDHEAILAYLDRTAVLGRTVSKSGSAKVGTNLVLTDQNGEFVDNTTSNETGYYLFDNVPNGDYSLSGVIYSTAMGGMWLTNVSEFTVENGTAVNITFAMRKNESNDHEAILAYLDRTAVSGRTVSKSGSAKVGTNLVLLKNVFTDENTEPEETEETPTFTTTFKLFGNATSNETGYYLFDNVPNGDYRLSGVIYSTAMGGMWLTNVSEFTVENGTPMNITFAMRKNESNDHEAILSYIDRTTVSGFTLSKSGSPKVGSDLILTDQNGEFVDNTTSNNTGYYLFDNVPNGDYSLSGVIYSTAMGGMWLTNVSEFTVENGTAMNITFAMRKNESNDHDAILAYLDRTTVSGLTLSKSGSPKVGTDLVLTDQNGEFVDNTTSNETGYYLFDNVPNGDYSLSGVIYSTAMGGMWLTNVSDFNVENGTPMNITFAMRKNQSNYHDAILAYLDRTTVSGLTLSKSGSPKVGTDLVLLKKIYAESGAAANGPHINIALITGYESYKQQFDGLVSRINENSTYNITVSYYLPSTLTEDVNLSDTDIIYVNMFTDSASMIEDEINAAIANGTVVIGYNTHLNQNIPYIPSVFSDEDDLRDYLQDYWIYGAMDTSNFDNMIFFLSKEYGGRDDLEVKGPDGLEKAIYHPDMTELSHFTSSATEYFDWYSNRTGTNHSFDENAPTVGILFYSSYYPDDLMPFDELIRNFESRGINVIPCYGSRSNYVDPFFNHTPETKVDLILSSTYRSQPFDKEDLGVPVMNTVLNGYMNLEEWEATNNPLPNTYMLRMYRPETWGWIDPIMIASEEVDSQGNDIYVPVDSQIDWLVDRAEAQTELSSKNESDKKVVILYYNHGAGKDNIGASYLEVVPSINNLLKGMADSGYDVESSSIPNETELVDLFVKQGTNIGTWAPGELEDLVETGKVTLIPEETYHGWFDELPEERKQEVVEMWGEAPGEVMIYEDRSGNSFVVIPKIEVSDNVILAPQPTRGWLQDNDALYHSGDLPPHHQYIAFYLWLQNEFDADVMVNMGRHGTVEWLPGKEFGLFRDEWPALMVSDIPVVYPYVMDGMGEGMQAKRRGNAIIIDHLIPPVVMSGSYGNYTELNDKISQYNALSSDPNMQELRYNEIVNLTLELHLDERVNMSHSKGESTREEFLDELDDVLRELRTTSMPYGLHILGTSPQDEQLSEMVCSMLGNDFKEEVALYNTSETAPVLLLDLVLNLGLNSTFAQEQVLGVGNNSVAMDDYLSDATEYAYNLGQSEDEVQQVLNAMDGKYIESNLGGDPILRPDALPSGRNFYAFDEQLIPTRQAWELGMDLANETIDMYKAENDGEYPNKVAFILWAGESTRHEGVMEAEILYLLGVRPVWDDDGDDVEDVVLIDSSELGRPRIDVLVQISGLYRDTFPHKVELIDKAVYLAYNAPDNGYGEKEERPTPEYIPYAPAENTNFVRENTNNIYEGLNTTFQNETASMTISLLRIFGPEDGAYGTGMANAISASDTWDNNTVLADLYMERMSNAYGEYVWGESVEDIVSQWDVADSSVDNEEVFGDNLEDVNAILHSRSSNTYGALDTDDFFQYMGGLSLVVGQASGTTPDTYIMNLQNPDAETIETLKTYLSREIVTRYLNPTWIEGMQQHGFEGAGMMGDFVENLWGWEAVCPDLIDDYVWDNVYETYMTGENSDWMKENNPYAYQSMNARMIETARKGNWDVSEEVLKTLIKEYVESVAENDVTCCHHTCGNPSLDNFISGQISLLGVDVDKDTLDKYNELMQDATHRSSETSFHKSSSNTPSANIVNSTSTSNDAAGYGTVTEQAPAPVDDNYVEGYEMTKETTSEENASSSGFSGSDVIATAVVLLAVGTIIYGFRRQRL